MRPRSFVAIVGFLVIILGTYCPLLKPFGLTTWNLYHINQPYGVILLLLSFAGVSTRNMYYGKIISWVTFLLVILLYIAALLKVHGAFSFIPFKGISGYLSRQIKFSWGWFVLYAGCILTVLTTWSNKKAVSR